MQTKNLVFIKLGGSLITDKHTPNTARLDIIQALAQEIVHAHAGQPDLQLLIGHGSGSFGHSAAQKYGTRSGVSRPQDWAGFAAVWQAARALNQVIIAALAAAGLPVIALPPSASAITENHQIVSWNTQPILAALAAGLIPVIQGDTIFDTAIGGTILSTEDLFRHLARQLSPRAILLAGIEPGVWADYPACTRLVERITPASFSALQGQIKGSSAVDVTGGMLTKVEQMLALIQANPGVRVQIFSALQPGSLTRAMQGQALGTTLLFE